MCSSRPPPAWSSTTAGAPRWWPPWARAPSGLQNSPLVTIDPNGTIGITIAGYNAGNAGLIQHYEIAGSAGHSLGKRSWPMFHQNPQLTGWIAQAALGHLNQPIVGMASTADGGGYWNVASDGGIFSFGDAAVLRLDRRHPPQPPGGGHGRHPERARATGWWPPTAASSPSATPPSTARPAPSGSTSRWSAWPPPPTGRGYWLVASDGGIFAFGDAAFHGSTGTIRLNRPVVGMAATPGGQGYWLVASDGGIFSFGDAAFHGSTGAIRLNQPVVGMAATPERPGLLAGGLRRRHLHLRQRPLLRLDRQHPAQPAGGRHGRHALGWRLLVGGRRRRDVLLRQCRLLRLDAGCVRRRRRGRHRLRTAGAARARWPVRVPAAQAAGTLLRRWA